MLDFLNYNFIGDFNALDPYPTTIKNIDSVKIQNAIYNDLYITEDTDSQFTTDLPTDWDIYTILWAKFEGNLNGGSVDFSGTDIDKIRIKRRIKGSYEWVTIFEKEIITEADFYFSGEDYFAANNTEYEYAWVPVRGGEELNYIISSIESQFRGVFIADTNTIYKQIAGVAYGPSQQVQLVGVYNPIGKQYPIYVSNGATNYQTGSVTGKIIGNYENTKVFNRKEMVQQKNAFIKWLTNKCAKILKDQNSNIWLIFITGEPSVSYDAQWGNGMMEISYQWGEIGEAEDKQSMQDAGLWPIVAE